MIYKCVTGIVLAQWSETKLMEYKEPGSDLECRDPYSGNIKK